MRAESADAIHVPDSVYELVQAFVAFMDRVTLFEALTLVAAGTIVAPLVVLIHEAGHALVAFALRRQVAELTVGDDAPVLTVRVGGFRLHLGAITGSGDAAGFVLYDGAAASPRNTLAIAIAGPLASLAGAVVTGVAAAWAWPSAGLSLFLGLATLGGLTLLRRQPQGQRRRSGVLVRWCLGARGMAGHARANATRTRRDPVGTARGHLDPTAAPVVGGSTQAEGGGQASNCCSEALGAVRDGTVAASQQRLTRQKHRDAGVET